MDVLSNPFEDLDDTCLGKEALEDVVVLGLGRALVFHIRVGGQVALHFLHVLHLGPVDFHSLPLFLLLGFSFLPRPLLFRCLVEGLQLFLPLLLLELLLPFRLSLLPLPLPLEHPFIILLLLRGLSPRPVGAMRIRLHEIRAASPGKDGLRFRALVVRVLKRKELVEIIGLEEAPLLWILKDTVRQVLFKNLPVVNLLLDGPVFPNNASMNHTHNAFDLNQLVEHTRT